MKKHTTKLTSKSIEGSGLPTDFKKAIAEYVWNGFDAGASEVAIRFKANEVDFLENLSITDNGSGISMVNISDTFGNFMVSIKTKSFSETGFIKGRKGKGRYSFQTFANRAIWNTTFKSDSEDFLNYKIQIDRETSQDFSTIDPIIAKVKSTGTTVHFEDFYNLTADLLNDTDFEKFLSSLFGWFLYLNKERDYKITINGKPIDYFQVIAETEDLDVSFDGFDFKISYIQWNEKIGDKYYYYFLNSAKKEKERKHTSFNNKTIDYHHSVYVESDFFDDFRFTKLNDPILDFAGHNQSHPAYQNLIKYLHTLITNKEKAFIKNAKASELIDRYNKNNVIPDFKSNPYEQLRKNDLENVIKELYAVQPKIFQNLTIPQSKTIVGFLNLLLDTEQREDVLNIVDNVVKLSDEERKDLAGTLKKSKLTHITALIKFLESRFGVVTILKTLIFDLEKFTNERDHIQNVIEGNYWLFGEQYHLVSADKNFETMLNNYLAHLEETNEKPKAENIDSKDKLKRPDIFICRKTIVPDANSSDDTVEENIIVELKRPSIEIGSTQFQQIERYLRFIIEEERFNSSYRKWKFFLVGKSVDSYIKDLYENQSNKGKKFLVQSIRNFEIYAMTWDDVFKLFELKHGHLIDKLEFKSAIVEELTAKGIKFDRVMSDELTKAAIMIDAEEKRTAS